MHGPATKLLSLALFIFISGCGEQTVPEPVAVSRNTNVESAPRPDVSAWREEVSRQRSARSADKAEQPEQETSAVTSTNPPVQARATSNEPSAELLERARNGDIEAQIEAAKLLNGRNNKEESIYWYRKAAEAGDRRAQYTMGMRYTYGDGVERDPLEAGKWFFMAAKQGHAQAQYSMGLRWVRGEAGEPQDFAEAAKWFQLAADQGFGIAQHSLARRYMNGEGVPQDNVTAYKWLFLSKQIAASRTAMQEVEGRMTPAEIAEAQAQAAAFVRKPPTPLP